MSLEVLHRDIDLASQHDNESFLVILIAVNFLNHPYMSQL